MPFRVPPAINKLLSRMPSAAKAQGQVANTGMDAMADAMAPMASPVFKEGVVERVGPGTYDATVMIPGYAPVGCSIMASTASNLYGASDCSLPVPGTRVLVYLPNRSSLYGVIVGALPQHDVVSVVPAESKKPPQEFAGMWELEAGATMGGNSGYSTPVQSPTFMATVRAGGARALDIMPGVHAVINDQQVGYSVSPLAVTLKATSRAQVRCSVVDENVRIVAGLFQFFGPDGTLQTFNDNGYVTEERTSTAYQCERSGMNSLGTPVFKQGQKTTLAAGSMFTRLQGVRDRIVPRKRLHSLMGFMGDIINLFVAKPDPDISEPETEDAQNKDQGLLQTHVDTSGRLHVRSANGILFERCDRIPVPKRLRQPWDPAGDKNIQPPPPKKPFEFSKDHPYGRSLHLRDANAWRTLEAYWHIHNQSTSTGHKDYYLPEEQELRVPDDNYDGPGQGTENFKDNDNRRAAVSMEPDGSIILRDAWGSEIIMRGGSIIISAAANIEVRAGKSIVGMGGQDIVMKARDSVDVTAERKDLRLAAGKNLHGAADGILLESTAESDTVEFKDKVGEDVVSAGITLKAAKSRVLATGRRAHIAGSQKVVVDTFGGSDGKSDDQNTGIIEISGGQFKVSAETLMTLNVGSDTGLELTKGVATLLSPNLLAVGTSGVAIMKGGEFMVPLKWAPAEGDVYAAMQERLTQQWERLSSESEGAWLEPYAPSARDTVTFTYRNSDQYGTLSPAEVMGASHFYVYQPAWAFMAQHGAQTVPASVDTWKETARNQTYPWPGAEARDKAYVTLPKEVNVEATTGTARSRKTLKPQGEAPKIVSFDEVEVIR